MTLEPGQRPALRVSAPKPPKPARAATASGDGSSVVPGLDATTATALTGARSAKPAYLRNPHPAYPDEAHRAGQEGVVTLRFSHQRGGRGPPCG